MHAIICSFSSGVAELPRGKRDLIHALRALNSDPKVSSFEMSESYRWLPDLIQQLEDKGWIIQVKKDAAFPWLYYEVTEAGKQRLHDEDRPPV